MDKNSKEAEIKRINDVLHRFDSEQDVIAPYEQAADLSSLMDADPEPIMLSDQDVPDPVVEAEAADEPTPDAETEEPDSPEPETEVAEHSPAPAVGDASQDSEETAVADDKGKNEKFRLSKGSIVIMVLSACMILGGIIFFISHPLSPGSGDAGSSEYAQTDVITYADGILNVNNVSVTVPVKNASYNITYTWGPTDEEYPTIPYSVTSSCYGEGGKLVYDITLYRDSVTGPDDIPKGKDASNWYSDWSTDDSETNLHVPKDSGSLHGFLVYTIDDTAEDSEGVTCGSTSYYFAVQDEEGLSQYVLEGILYDKSSLENYRKVMEDCINSIKVS